MTYIDLFAGAGGLSEGFIRHGFKPVAHVEMDSNACLTLKTRLSYHYLKNNNKSNIYNNYLSGVISREELYKNVPDEIIDSVFNYEITDKNINEIFDKINNKLKEYNNNKIDIIIGGPPCQAYSLIGRSVVGEKIKEDKRNYLYKLYGKFLIEFNPDLFVFENVPGLLTAAKGKHYNNIKEYFDDIGYQFEAKILNSSDFGVLQNRKRLIIIGWKKGMDFKYPEFEEKKSNYTINDLFKDLPELIPGQVINYGAYKKKPEKIHFNLKIREKNDVLIQHVTRPNNINDLHIYKLAIDKWLNHKQRLLYTDIPEKYQNHKNKNAFLDRFKVVNGDGISHTLVAHIAKDGHYYIYPDLNQIRSISIREAARIQSFPDNYYFESSRTSAFKQIGNAVPPLMAEKIAEKIKEMVNGK
jgi:DNA (cytosine-5)-methyltransferase 1